MDVLRYGATIDSTIGGNPVVVTADKIATFMNFQRPEGDTNYPRRFEDRVSSGSS